MVVETRQSTSKSTPILDIFFMFVIVIIPFLVFFVPQVVRIKSFPQDMSASSRFDLNFFFFLCRPQRRKLRFQYGFRFTPP